MSGSLSGAWPSAACGAPRAWGAQGGAPTLLCLPCPLSAGGESLLDPGRVLRGTRVCRWCGGPARPLSVRGIWGAGRGSGQTLCGSNIHPRPSVKRSFTEGQLTAHRRPLTGSTPRFGLFRVGQPSPRSACNTCHIPQSITVSSDPDPLPPRGAPRTGVLGHVVDVSNFLSNCQTVVQRR